MAWLAENWMQATAWWFAFSVGIAVIWALFAPPRDLNDDTEQWRWILENNFVVALDNLAYKKRSHGYAWEVAFVATNRDPTIALKNMTTWSDEDVLKATQIMQATIRGGELIGAPPCG